MSIEQKLDLLIENVEDIDLDLLESVRQKVALEEAKKSEKKEPTKKAKKSDTKKDDEKKEPADDQDQEPAVKIDNPINPQLDSSDAEDGSDDDQAQKQKMQQANESISSLFGEEFSEDFKLKASTIFEAALKEKVTQIENTLKAEYAAKATALQESFEVKLVEETSKIEESLSEDINGYLTSMTEEWMHKNELAIHAGIKAELTESFINGMKTLFEEHYIDVPESKVDLFAKLEEEKNAIEEQLSESKMIAEELTEKITSMTREHIIAESAKDFTGLDFQRFKVLTEDFDFENEDQFRKKMAVVKKAFFEAKQEKAGNNKDRIMESFTPAAPIIEEQIINPDVGSDSMNAYLRYLNKK
jgi:hypothetical protein